MAKLTIPQIKALRRLAEKPQDLSVTAASSLKSGKSIRSDVYKRLIAMGWAEYYGNIFSARITQAGRDYMAALDAPAEYTWTEAELALYDPDEPMPPARPGQFVIPPESVQYEYEIAALKRQLAEQIDHAAILDQERTRLLAIQAELIDRITRARKHLEEIPEAKITPENTRFVLETVNFAYSYLFDVNETTLDTLVTQEEG